MKSALTLILIECTVFALSSQGQNQSPPLVDHHQHLFSPATAKFASGAGRGTYEEIDAAKLIALLDAAGIRRAVVLSVAYQFGNPNMPPIEHEYESVKAENDWTSAQVARFPDRLRGFCGVNPLKDYAVDEIARCSTDPSLRFGLKLHFGNSDVDLDDPQHVDRLRRVFRAADEHRMALAVHMRASVTRKRPYGRKEAAVFLNDVLPAAPDVPVQIAHLTGGGGYDDPTTDEALSVFIGAIARHDPRVGHLYFDVSGVAGNGKWGTKAELIVSRIRQIGVERILFGSDSATGGGLVPAEAWAAFRKLPLSDAEFQTIATNVAPYMR
jgi:predicted TIM-barrel fold metal-dependent hydrolase